MSSLRILHIFKLYKVPPSNSRSFSGLSLLRNHQNYSAEKIRKLWIIFHVPEALVSGLPVVVTPGSVGRKIRR